MGAKKKVASKTDTLAATTPSREPSNIDFGFTLTGNMELDFPEGMKKYTDPPPRVIVIDEQREEQTEEEKRDEKAKSLNDKYEEQKPKLVAICRSETEGKNTTKYIVELIVKNWQFRAEEAKILSICMEKHEKIESVQFTRTKLTKEALESLHLPSSVKFISIHQNDLSDPDLIDGLLKKGPPHLGIQYNNIGYPECEIIAEKLRNNETITTLNISGNNIGDAGAQVIARSILFNKKLAALSMQNCNLTDTAARDLAAVLSRRVEMKKDEIFRWRKSRMELIVASNSQLQLTIQPTKQKRPGSEHSSQTGKESSRKNKRQTVHEKPEKGGKGAGKRKSNSNVVENKVSSSPKIPETNIPDETGIQRAGGKMYTPGNRTLYSLNLENNKITSDGINAILYMLNDHFESEKNADESSTMLHYVRLGSNLKTLQFDEDTANHKSVEQMINFYKTLKLSESERFGNIITGLQIPLLTGSTSSLRSNPRLNEIKEEN